ncbi:MAG: CRISPR-associated helicase/endonuclease Cas3, partial [Haloarculaceae archaeon]
SVAGFHAVLCHHIGLPNINTFQSDLRTREKQFSVLSGKLHDIDEHASTQVDTLLRRATGDSLTWSDIPLDEPREHCQPIFDFRARTGFYPFLLRVWSTLTCADKLDAARIPSSKLVRPEPDEIDFDTDADGITEKLNQRRTAAREEAVQKLTHDDEPGLFTLTLPTGFGKTFAGLEAALERADRTGGRVVYALPYTTVIDQVDEEIRDQFGVSPTSEQYTIHHHLADTRTEFDAGEERLSSRAEAMYGETWQAGLVLTTVVQLFESLAGPGNVQSIKLPALENSVVIVDEPQVLPRRWWHLVSRLATVLVEQYDATLVLMTATQPGFVDEYTLELDATELIGDTDEYFEFLSSHERVQFVIDDSLAAYLADKSSSDTLPIETAAERLLPSDTNERETRLAISNTVVCASEVGRGVETIANDRGHDVISLNAALPEFVANRGRDVLEALRSENPTPSLTELSTAFLNDISVDHADSGILVGTLTAALRPIDRTLLIEVLRRLADKDIDTRFDSWSLVVSATQIVEAGVDISFDRVYRDVAPLPSLVQAAGRCNRSFERDTGTVTLWRLATTDDSQPPSERTYRRHRSHLEATRTTLRDATTDGPVVREVRMVSRAVDEYYSRLHCEDHTVSDGDDLVRSFDRAEGENLRSASLIDDDATEFLVLTNETDRKRLETYVADRKDGAANREAFTSLTYLFASTYVDEPDIHDDTTRVLAEFGRNQTELDELRIVDARDSNRYSVADGLGLYSAPAE